MIQRIIAPKIVPTLIAASAAVPRVLEGDEGDVIGAVALIVVEDGIVSDGVAEGKIVSDGVTEEIIVSDGVVEGGIVSDGVVEEGIVSDNVADDVEWADGDDDEEACNDADDEASTIVIKPDDTAISDDAVAVGLEPPPIKLRADRPHV